MKQTESHVEVDLADLVERDGQRHDLAFKLGAVRAMAARAAP